MTRRFAVSTMAFLSVAPGLLVGACLLFDAVTGQSRGGSEIIHQAGPAAHVTPVGGAG